MLYIVSTPIGNLSDITLRALEVLKEVDLIACEDTRHTKILLDKYEIDKKLISYHQHSGEAKIAQIIGLLEEGKDVAIVTDAGTPGISDPGSKLIKKAIEAHIDVTSIPGPAAFTSALSVSGFDTSEFVFIGFLPHKKGRQTKLNGIAGEKRTVALYESVHRINKLLGELNEVIPDRDICVTRELTKKFEEIYRGKPGEIEGKVKEKGEFAVVIEGKK
ncbi:MAG: 16S rRNA (cytidine(1402)-2'-O)-methyltransferase [bacterium]|nr:16S rRNA (cytidine(1402)-2'-O)-methyltransferase [bacterium]